MLSKVYVVSKVVKNNRNSSVYVYISRVFSSEDKAIEFCELMAGDEVDEFGHYVVYNVGEGLRGSGAYYVIQPWEVE